VERGLPGQLHWEILGLTPKVKGTLARNPTVPSQVNHILAAQWLVTLCAAGILFAVKREWALSVLMGGLICVLPNMYFARQLFARRHSVRLPGLAWSAYGVEIIKIVLTLALFAVVFLQYKEVHPVALLVTYLAAHSCNWAVPLMRPGPAIQKTS